MTLKISIFLWICIQIGSTRTSNNSSGKIKPRLIIKTCSCNLRKLPALREFLENDLSEYGNLIEVTYEKDAPPEFLYRAEDESVTKTTPVEMLSRSQIRQILSKEGIMPFFPLEDLEHSEDL
jgi:hypothetical protein